MNIHNQQNQDAIKQVKISIKTQVNGQTAPSNYLPDKQIIEKNPSTASIVPLDPPKHHKHDKVESKVSQLYKKKSA